MEKRRLTYRFHDPNPDKAMEAYIRQILVRNGVNQVFDVLAKCREQEYGREGEAENEHCSLLPCIDR